MLEQSDIEDYESFVQKKLEYIERYMDIIKNKEITPQIINHALANHGNILNWLDKEYDHMLMDYESLKEDYQADFDTWIIESRALLNEKRVSSKYASNAEIEGQARVTHREDYTKWKRKLLIWEHKISFYKRIRNNWEAQRDILTNLSWNTRAELRSLTTEDYTNNVYKDKIQKKPISKES
jgi:hypothetical protein